MQKITLEKYFNTSEVLSRKTKEDFTNYRDKLYLEKYEYKENNKLEELLKYTVQCKEEQISKVFEYLDNIKYILFASAIFAFFFTYLFFNRDINIGEYLIFSVGIPFAYFTWLVYKYSKYTKGVKVEKSLASNILKIKFDSEDIDKYSQPLRTYSLLALCKIGITYTLGVLLATFITFNIHSITFYIGSTYEANEVIINNNTKVPAKITSADMNKTIKLKKVASREIANNTEAYIQSKSTDTNKTSEIIKPNNAREIKSHPFWSRLITISIMVVLILKLIILFFAKRNLNDSIKDSLLLQGKSFFDVMDKTIEFKPVTSSEDNSTIKTVIPGYNTPNEDAELFDYYILYYQMDLNLKNKIDFNFSNDVELNAKTSESYSFAIFDKEDEDEDIILKLGNLVIMFISPESSADNTFKDDIEAILKRDEIKQIWILPLVENNNTYILAQKGDDKYDEWQKQINENINNIKVRLYNEK